MTDVAARRQLKMMLKSFKAGSVPHLLGEVFEDTAEEVNEAGEARHEKYRAVETTLFAVGMRVECRSAKTACTLIGVNNLDTNGNPS